MYLFNSTRICYVQQLSNLNNNINKTLQIIKLYETYTKKTVDRIPKSSLSCSAIKAYDVISQ